MQKAFVFDINKCTGCQACQLACGIENGLEPERPWREIHTFNESHLPGIESFHLSLACNHCVDPPCMRHCPANAYTKDPDTGAVEIVANACIGCRYCAWACPYDAPRFNDRAGIMEKCTFCQHRLGAGKEPACVALCPTGALSVADDGDAPGVPHVAGFPDVPVEAAIRFIPRSSGAAVATDGTEHAPAAGTRPPASKISLGSEWPLLVFTLIAALLTGWIASVPSGAAAFLFVALGAGAMGLSTAHLGRPGRAMRAVLNWRRSWLSREIVLFGVFMAASATGLLAGVEEAWFRVLGVGSGLLALFAMDQVYRVTRTVGLRMHSAQLVLTGALLAALFSGAIPLAQILIGAKAILYLFRKYRFAQIGERVRPAASALRLSIGLLLPLLLLSRDTGGSAALLTCIALGEVIDRCEFYLELDVPTPRRAMQQALRARRRTPLRSSA